MRNILSKYKIFIFFILMSIILLIISLVSLQKTQLTNKEIVLASGIKTQGEYTIKWQLIDSQIEEHTIIENICENSLLCIISILLITIIYCCIVATLHSYKNKIKVDLRKEEKNVRKY